MQTRRVATVIPADGVFRFRVRARREGAPAKAGMRITVPRPVVRGLEHVGWGGGWLRVRVNGGTACFGVARAPNRKQTAIPLSVYARGSVRVDDVVDIELCDASGFRAHAGVEVAGYFDWATVVPRDAFATDEKHGVLSVHAHFDRPFRIRRRAQFADVRALLDLYAVHGAKDTWSTEWRIDSTNASVLELARASLMSCGVETDGVTAPAVFRRMVLRALS